MATAAFIYSASGSSSTPRCDLRQRLVEPPLHREDLGQGLSCARVVRIALDRGPCLAFSAVQVVFEAPLDHRHDRPGLGETRVDLQRALSGGPGPRKRLGRRHVTVVPLRNVSLGKTGVRERIRRVALDGFAEVVHAPRKTLLSALRPIEAPFQVQVIRLDVAGVTASEYLRVLAR